MTIACTADGCDRAATAKGLCLMHYKRWRRYGDPDVIVRRPRAGRLCAVAGCGEPVLARDWCSVHYQRWRTTGDPTETCRMGPEPIPLLERYTVDPTTGCWIFDGTHGREVHGSVRYRGRLVKASRLAMHLWRDFDLDDSRLILHSCDNPPCINPDHLRPGSYADNAADMVSRGRHCKTGQVKRLTWQDVCDIRARSERGESQSSLAAAFGITPAYAGNIVRHERRRYR